MTLLPLLAGNRPDTVTLRSAKSEESLSSQTSGAGEHHACAHGKLGRAGALSWLLNVVLQIWGSWIFLFFVWTLGAMCCIKHHPPFMTHCEHWSMQGPFKQSFIHSF